MEILSFNTNPFGGVLVDPLMLPEDSKQFRIQLAYSLEKWISEGFKVVWLEIPLAHSNLVPIAAEAGLSYHHADTTYLMMTRQLEQDAYVPPYATHYIGAGAVVLSEARELLVVSERYRFRGSRGPAYKLPGGALQPGEHLAEGVVREVLEETGVQTKFETLACFRHWHGYRYGKSDIYFVCRLSPISHDITMQEEEIAECLWMPVDDFLTDQDISSFNKSIVNAALNYPGMVPSSVDGYGDPDRFEFFLPDSHSS